MLLVLAVILVLVIFILGLVSALLLVPFDVSFKVAGSPPAIAGEFSIRWLGLRIIRRSITGQEARKVPRPAKRKADPMETLRLFREAIPSFKILFRALRRSVSLLHLSLEVTVGLDDPAETAALSGYVWAISQPVKLPPGASFVFTPNFGRAGLGGSAAADLKMRLLPLVTGFLRAYTKKPFRAFVREMRR